MKLEQTYRTAHGLFTVSVESKTLEGHSMMTGCAHEIKDVLDMITLAMMQEIKFDERTAENMRLK
jgi:hypothetical protein